MAYPAWLPILLGILTAVGPLSTDMYLPAFPALERDFGVPAGSAQITLATWFFGLAVGQLVQGSLSDRFGRRRPLIVATAIYTLASIGCALSPSLTVLAGFRFVTAIGGSAAMVIPRAVVRDIADGQAAARLMSRLILVMGAAPILAPTLGGLTLTVAPWRAIFWISAAHGAVCCALVWWKLPETLPLAKRARLGVLGLARRYLVVLGDRGFLAFAVMSGGGMFGMFAYISGSSQVLIEHFGFSPAQYGMLFGSSAASYIVGSQLAPVLFPRFGASRAMRVAAAIYLAAATVFTGFALLGRGGILGVVPPMMVVMGCMGLITPGATVGALSRHAAQAGSASAMMGMLTFCLAALAGGLVGALGDGTARPMAVLVLIGAICVGIADRLRPAPPGTEARVR